MNTKSTFNRIPKLTAFLAVLAFAGLLAVSSCKKDKAEANNPAIAICGTSGESAGASGATTNAGKGGPRQVLTSIVTVAGIRPVDGSSSIEVYFNENTQFFSVTEAGLINTVKDAYSANKPLLVTFNPWDGSLVSATTPRAQDVAAVKARLTVYSAENARKIDFTKVSDDVLNEPQAMGILNTTDPGLNNLIPDFATAQLMFDYIAHQCCALPGPFAIDYCISFQYCQDGCYARAHKMCWIINNRYKYGTKKIFSFANAGADKLCVQGQKWGGCCIRWWYHVAPLVTIKTPTGPKAYVFDPAMFNQPVLLATWLHAQENPVCATGSMVAHVTMINVQPTTSYAPSGSSGLVFGTDPSYTSTNNTLYNYRNLITCP